MSLRRVANPAPLVVSVSLVAIEGLLLVLGAGVEIANLDSGRLTMGLTTSIFFAAYGAGLIACAWALRRGQSWARSPVVLAQLIQLGLAWSFRGGSTTLIAVLMALVAVIVLIGLFHPASLEALSDGPDDEPAGT